MDQVGIIKDLLTWLDNHLDRPLTLDHVAAKSGYSKWHLQRMFKEVTGWALGSYIRQRRLTLAAFDLRITRKSILEIAIQYHFDSQQTFTRAFKKQFNQTPANYRRAEEWDFTGVIPTNALSQENLPTFEYVSLPELSFISMKHHYNCSLDQMEERQVQLREGFWHTFLGTHVSKIPFQVYALYTVTTEMKINEEQEVTYITAVEPEDAPAGLKGTIVTVPEKTYVKFRYHGPIKGLQHFIVMLYHRCLPLLNVGRPKIGFDIEVYHPYHNYNTDNNGDIESQDIECDYLIPIRPKLTDILSE